MATSLGYEDFYLKTSIPVAPLLNMEHYGVTLICRFNNEAHSSMDRSDSSGILGTAFRAFRSLYGGNSSSSSKEGNLSMYTPVKCGDPTNKDIQNYARPAQISEHR